MKHQTTALEIVLTILLGITLIALVLSQLSKSKCPPVNPTELPVEVTEQYETVKSQEYIVEPIDYSSDTLTVEEFKEYFKLKAITCKTLPLTSDQLRTLAVIKTFAKDYDLINTMSAIALQESSLDNSKVNKYSGALGLGQILPSTAKAIAISRNEFTTEEELKSKLTSDIRMNLIYMLNVLQYYTEVNSKEGYVNHNKVWLGYYSGHAYDDSTNYDRDIVKKIKTMKQCGYI